MAQAGYTPISLYYSAVTGSVPTGGQLVPGELALNTRDGNLYYKASSGTVTLLASSNSGSIPFTNINYTGYISGVAGNGKLISPTGNGFDTLSSLTVQGPTTSGTREFLANFGLTNASGYIASTTLSSTIDASVTTVPVASTTGFPTTGSVLIGSEYISYTGKTSVSFTGCTRGYLSTTPASHTSGATVAPPSWEMDKVVIYAGMDMNGANCGDGWSFNTVLNVNSGSRATANAIGYELDFNNNRGDQTSFFSGPLMAGLAINSAGYKSQTALYIGSSDLSGSWQNGISFLNAAVADSAIYSLMGSNFKINVADAYSFVVATNNAERMRITGAGNVGVGTATPFGKLESASGSATTPAGVFKDAGTLPTITAGTQLVVAGDLTNNSYGTALSILGGSTGSAQIGVNFGSEVNDKNGWVNYNNATNALYLGTNGTNKVGIESGGTINTTASLELGSLANTNQNIYVDFHASAGTDYDARILRDTGVNGALNIANAGTGAMTFSTNLTQRMRIDSAGNVGIGTTTPTSQLQVYGAGQTTGNMSTTTGLGGTLYLQDTGTVLGSGGAVLFGANQGAFAAIKGYINDGTTNTTGELIFSNRRLVADATLTEAMRIAYNGNVGIGTNNPTKLLTVNGDALIHGITVGLGANSVSTNVVVSDTGLSVNTTGAFNVAVGSDALHSNTTGQQNNAIGRGALGVNTSGNYNNAVGVSTLASNTEGSNNNAFGLSALSANTTGSNNSAIGFYSLPANTTGADNVAIGSYTLFKNTTGGGLTAIGNQALNSCVTVNYNTAVGYQAALNTTAAGTSAFGAQTLLSNTTGSGNAAFGTQFIGTANAALQSNTTGFNNAAFASGALGQNTTGSYNAAFGLLALAENRTGSSNSAFGVQALDNNIASNNTAVGFQALLNNTSGSANVALGYLALQSNTTGNYGTAIGHTAGYNSTGSNNTLIGTSAGYSVTTGEGNTFIGGGAPLVFGSGYYMTTGSKNTILGNFNGNQGGLDIRTLSNYLVLSDGDGNPLIYHNGTTVVIPNLPTSASGLPTGALWKDTNGFLKVA